MTTNKEGLQDLKRRLEVLKEMYQNSSKLIENIEASKAEKKYAFKLRRKLRKEITQAESSLDVLLIMTGGNI